MSVPPPSPERCAETKGPTLLAVAWTFTTLACIVVGSRIFTRLKLVRSFGLDDILIVIAWLISFVYSIMCIVAVVFGNGKHLNCLTARQASEAIKINSFALLPAVLTFSFPKLAVAALLTRLLKPSIWQRVFMYFLCITVIILSLLNVVFLFAQCKPPTVLWHPELEPIAVCWKPHILIEYAIFGSAYSAFIDLYLSVYPSTVLWTLNMSMRKRLGLCFALGLGFCATVIAVYKCTKIPTLLNHSDYTYATMELFIWTSIEANAIIIAACLPTLRPLYRCLMGKSYTSDDASNQTNGRSSYFMNSLQNTQSKQRSKKPSKEDTNNFATIDNASEERILSRNRIHQTFDVNINYEQRRERSGSDIISDMKHPGAETIYAGDRV